MKFTKWLIIIFIILVLVKIGLSLAVPTLSAYSDEYAYAKMAQSFYQSAELTVHGEPFSVYPPVYPIVLSLSYIFSSIAEVFVAMKIINAIISTLIIFPIYLFARKFVSNNWAFTAAIFAGIIPSTFSFAPYLLSENIFYLFLVLAIYFVYELFSKNKWYHAAIAGLFIGLCAISKASGLVLIAVPITLALWQSIVRKKLQKSYIKFGVLLYVVAFLILGTWLLRNGLLFGFNLQGIFGNAVARNVAESLAITDIIIPFLVWVVLYAGYLLLASGVLFGLLSFGFIKEHFWKNSHEGLFIRLFILSVGLFIAVAANHSSTFSVLYNSPFSFVTYRPIGRYIEGFLPLIIMMGFIVFERRKEFLSKSVLVFGSVLAVVSSLLTLAPLFPSNNPSLTWLGGITFFLKQFNNISLYDFSWTVFLVVAVMILVIAILMKWVISWDHKKIVSAFAIFFLIVSVLSVGVTISQANKWADRPDIQAVMNYFPEIEGQVLFDQESCGVISLDGAICEKVSTVSGFWIMNDIVIGDPSIFGDAKYIISNRELEFAALVKHRGFILYKTFL